MNLNVVNQLLARLSTRAKLIAVGVICFGLGLLLRGGSTGTESGRYVPCLQSGHELCLLDTRSGEVWVLDQNNPQHFRRLATIPYF